MSDEGGQMMNIEQRDVQEAIKWAKNFKANFADGITQVKELAYADKMLGILINFNEILLAIPEGLLPEKKESCHKACRGGTL